MRLSTLSPDQALTLRHLISQWRDQSDVLLDGTLHVSGAQHGYELVRADRADLQRSTIIRYSPVVVELDHDQGVDVTIINATTDPHLVLRLTRPITRGTVRTADGTEVTTIRAAPSGLTEIPAPAWGSITLRSS